METILFSETLTSAAKYIRSTIALTAVKT
jgi:hypothetical protein